MRDDKGIMTANHNMSPLFKKLTCLTGVGPSKSRLLARLGLHNVYDLLFHIPRNYEDRRRITPIRDIREGEYAVVSGRVSDVNFKRIRSRQRMLEVFVSDSTGMIQLTWFHARPSWAESFQKKNTVTAYGKVQYYGGPQMVSPVYTTAPNPEQSAEFGCILPVYPLTEGLSQKFFRRIMREALTAAAEVADAVPHPLARAKSFTNKTEAIRNVHFPPSLATAEHALRRLAYEELLVFQAALALQRRTIKDAKGFNFKTGRNVEQRIRRLFPFRFTDAQNKVVGELCRDLRSQRPMHRLLQGDVGCGKTVVAVYALLSALAERSKGHQTAFMAPTEVLAEQHYLTLQELLDGTDVRIMLLKGSAKPAERREKLQRIAEGRVDLVVGTHALIQKDVAFNKLALAVIDEQHRFGVRQRLELAQKGRRPDVLLMTATPIPRTLTLACFGDMDVSVIDRMPPGRREVNTRLLGESHWKEAYQEALSELKTGGRVFVIFPLVETNHELDLSSATDAYRVLSNGIFKDYPCCLMHGRMSAETKRETMRGFRNGDYRVMVATTVVEVGIDVAEATVMIVQHAERLGLSQLHQLRGRIGRGGRPGFCFLLASDPTEDARRRLEVLCNTNDGFKIAEADLKLRGPGELFGTQQSGMPELRCYDFSDLPLLEEVRNDAFELIENDPGLDRQDNQLLKKAIRQGYAGRFALGGMG